MLNEEVRKVAKVGFGVGKVGLAVAFNKRNLFSGKRIAGILLKRVLDLKDFGLDIELEVSDRGAVHILEAADGLLVAVAHDQTTGGEEYWIFNLVQDWNTDSTTLAEVLQKTAIKGSFREKVSSVDIRGNMVCFAFYSKTIAFFDLGSGESNKMNLSQVVTTDLVFSKFLPNGLLSVCSDGFIIITQDEKHLPQQHLKQEVVDCQLILEATSTLHLLLIATTSTIKLFMIVGTVTSLIATLNTQGPPTTNSQGSEKQPLARSTLFKSDTGTYLITAKYDGYMDCYRLEI